MVRLPSLIILLFILLLSSVSTVHAIDFSDILGQKSRELERIYKSQLPLPVGDSITSSNKTSNTTSQTVHSQSESQSDTSVGAAGGYVINRGIKTPTLENTPVTTDLGSFFASLFAKLGDIFGIGTKEAKNFADTYYPSGVGEKVLESGQTRLIQQSPLSQMTESTRVLGLSGQDESMGKSLEVVKCGALPVGLCQGNLQNGSPLNAPIEPPVVPPPSVTYTGILYYKTDMDTAQKIDALVPNFLAKMESDIAPRFKTTYPTSYIDSWHQVVDASYKSGFDSSDALHMWNPLFVLSIWIEETHAGDACGLGKPVWEMGVIKYLKTECNDPNRLAKFNDQLFGFVNIITKVNQPKTIDQFLCRFSEGKEIGEGEKCTFTINPQFPNNLAKVYYCLLKGTYPNDCDSGGEGGDVDLLVSAIGKNCIEPYEDADGKPHSGEGVVSVRNVSCLDKLNTDASAPFSDAVVTELKSFVGRNFEFLQCVGFVRSAFLLSSAVVLPDVVSAINFSQLTNSTEVQFVSKNSSGPGVGDVVVFDTMIDDSSSGFLPSPNGHVAIVIKTNVDTAHSFQIAEANWGPRGKVRNDRVIQISHAQLVGWVQKI